MNKEHIYKNRETIRSSYSLTNRWNWLQSIKKGTVEINEILKTQRWLVGSSVQGLTDPAPESLESYRLKLSIRIGIGTKSFGSETNKVLEVNFPLETGIVLHQPFKTPRRVFSFFNWQICSFIVKFVVWML